jgi:hypothetical protein
MEVPHDLFLAGLVLSLILYITSLSWYHHRRNHFPLKQRHPTVVILELLCSGGIGTVIVLSDLYPESHAASDCSTVMYSINAFVYFLMAIMVCRLLWIWHRDFVTKIGIKNQEQILGFRVIETDENAPKINTHLPLKVERFLVRHLAHLQLQKLFIAITVFLVLAGIGDFIVVYRWTLVYEAAAVTAHSYACLPVLQASVSYKMVFFALVTCFIMCLSMSLLNLKDNFGIRREMISLISLMIGVVVFLACILITPVAEWLLIQTKLWGFMIGLVFMPGVYFSQAIRVIWLSYAAEKAKAIADTKHSQTSQDDQAANFGKRELQEADRILEKVKEVIADPIGKKMLREFMQTEFSIENLMFVEACTNYERMFQKNDEDQIAAASKMAKSIFENFVKTDAPFTVNLPFGVQKELTAKLSKLNSLEDRDRGMLTNVQAVQVTIQPPQTQVLENNIDMRSVLTIELFATAKDEIVRLIARDTFSRFKMSDGYAFYKETKKKSKAARMSGFLAKKPVVMELDNQ